MTPKSLMVAATCAVVLAGISGAGALAQGGPSPEVNIQQTTEETSFGFTLSPPKDASPAISADEAVKIAQSSPLPTGDQRAEAVLAHVVWKPGDVDQDAWVVTVAGTCVPLLGGSPDTSEKQSQWAVGVDVFLVDANEGSGLMMANTFQQSLDASSCEKDPTGNSLPGVGG